MRREVFIIFSTHFFFLEKDSVEIEIVRYDIKHNADIVFPQVPNFIGIKYRRNHTSKAPIMFLTDE